MRHSATSRAVLGCIPRMPKEPLRPWRDVVFICDEYQHFATVGENHPGGDEKFFSLSRQARLVSLVATQSISSLRSALPGELCRTLLQTLRARIFLTLCDESSCKLASEACGQVERLKEGYSISESSQSGVGLLSGRARGGIVGTADVLALLRGQRSPNQGQRLAAPLLRRTISLTRWYGTPIASARSRWVSSSGLRKSSRSISPGWVGAR